MTSEDLFLTGSVRASPRNRAGKMALRIYSAALKAVRADALIQASVRLSGSRLAIRDREWDLSAFRRILVVGAGKASTGMAAALEEVLGDRITGGVVVTKHGHSIPTKRIRTLEASHPLPGEDSLQAGREIHALAESAGRDDLVICLLSGGASALMELPVEGISLEDLRLTTEILQNAGADITELNAVRRRLSRLKAGGLSAACSPAQVLCLAISDVLGNPLPVIGSGPCWISESSGRPPMDVAARLGIEPALPPNVRRQLAAPSATPDSNGNPAPHFILGDVWSAIEAARAEALSLGLRPLVLTGSLVGEARHAARFIAGIANDMERSMPEVDCLIAGGETTVTVTGPGRGGRAQELAAESARGLPEGAALLSAGTDGTDGPTDAAGALVDFRTWPLAAELGVDPAAALEDNDSYRLLEAADSLIFTGPTQTNVNDLVILVAPQA